MVQAVQLIASLMLLESFSEYLGACCQFALTSSSSSSLAAMVGVRSNMMTVWGVKPSS